MANEDVPELIPGIDVDPVTHMFLPGNRSKGGRPKGSISIMHYIKNALDEISPDGRRNAAQVIAENIVQEAMNGRDFDKKLIVERIDGPILQRTDITTGGQKLPTPLLANLHVPNNNSDPEDSPAPEAT